MTSAAHRPARPTLAELAPGAIATIEDVDAAHARRLAVHGFLPGIELQVERDAPFGGPRIVRLGVTRVAVARSIARGVHVRPRSIDLDETP